MIERQLDIATPDGATTTFIVHPEREGPYPVVLFLMDAPAIREELRDMARRLASVGYYVMLPNLYYRSGVMELWPFPTEPAALEAARDRMFELMGSLSPALVMSDCAAMLAFNAAFEVSAHRIGTLFPVILLAGLALPPTKGSELGAMLKWAAKVGGALFMAIGLVWLAGGLGLPAASVNAPAATVTVPATVELVNGVNSAEYEVPEPEKAESVPPVTSTSAAVKSVAGSLRVKVSVAVSRALRLGLLDAMATEGATSSIVIEGVSVPAVLALPATSAKDPAATPTVPLVAPFGTNTAV